jgi:hypothetical protein
MPAPGQEAPPADPNAAPAPEGQDPNLMSNPEAQAIDMQTQMVEGLPAPAEPATPPAPFEEAPVTGMDSFNKLIGG